MRRGMPGRSMNDPLLGRNIPGGFYEGSSGSDISGSSFGGRDGFLNKGNNEEAIRIYHEKVRE